MIFLALFALPLLVAVIAFVALRGITWKEFAAQVVVQAIVAGASAAIVCYANVADTEVWNGVVTKKWSEHVSCGHSYSCNCTTSCDSKNNCSTICQTCYEHSYDVDWNVRTSNGEELDIDRVDRQGLVEPPRWAGVVVGEPTSISHHYVNYIKGAPDTLFRHQGLVEKYAANIPSYPGAVFDYYRLNRLVSMGVALRDTAQWNSDLSALNGDLGARKQCNILVVVTKVLPQEYFYALQEAWLGGKKNDIVLVVNVDDSLSPQWASVMAWTTNELFSVKLQDDVMAAGALDKAKIISLLHDDVSALYQRKHMHDFQYLEGSIVPTTTEWVISLLVGLVLCIGLTWFFAVNDVFGDEIQPRRYGRR